MEKLPEEIIISICLRLNAKSIVALSLANQMLRHVVTNSKFLVDKICHELEVLDWEGMRLSSFLS